MKRFVLCLLMGYSIGWGQELDEIIQMEELIILNNPLQIPIEKENRNIEILTQEEIQRYPNKNLQDVLQSINGLDLRQRGPMGTQADISMDGGSFEQTLLLLNGSKIIDQQTAHNVLNLPIPLDAIKRIEILRGPAARVFGINSLTGAINIITKDSFQDFFVLSTYTGSNFKKDTSNHRTYLNQGIKGGLSVSHNNWNNQFYFSHDKGNGYRYNTAFENNKLFYQTHWKLNTNHKILASYGYIKNGFGANAFYAPPGDKEATETIETTLVQIHAENKLSNHFIITPKLNYRYNYDDYKYFKHEIKKGRSQHYTHSFSTELNALWTTKKTKWAFGTNFRKDEINSTNIHQHKRENWGLFTDFKWQGNKRWDLGLGAYLNYNSQYGWEIFPGIDTHFAIHPNWKLKANIGTSQRIPSFTDLYLDQKPGNIGNANLLSEKALQSEVGIQFQRNNLTINAYGFHRTIRDFIDWTKTNEKEPWQAHNVGNHRTRGFNTQLSYDWRFNFQHQLNIQFLYTYLDSDIQKTENNLNSKYKLELLKHQFIQKINWEYRNTTIGLINRFHHRMNHTNYWLTDVRFQQKIASSLSFFLDINNLFNTEYSEIGSIPLPSRWLTTGFKFNFM